MWQVPCLRTQTKSKIDAKTNVGQYLIKFEWFLKFKVVIASGNHKGFQKLEDAPSGRKT